MNVTDKKYYEQLKIIAADYILQLMIYSEDFNIDRTVAELDINKIVPELSKENAKRFSLEFQHQIYHHLLHSGYVERVYPMWSSPNKDKWCKLTDHGKEVKRYGGHIAYLEYRNKMDKVPFESLKWSRRAAFIGLGSIVVSIILWLIDMVLKK